LIFLDPPFQQRGKIEVLEQIARREILKRGGTLIIHLSREEEKKFPGVIGGGEEPDDCVSADADRGGGGQLRLSDRRLYGGSLLLFYR
jgi:hypothetical protein